MVESYIPGYPRPQFVRPGWQTLDGTWQFEFDDDNEGIKQGWFHSFPDAHSEIQVPFSPECSASGIGRIMNNTISWYRRTFSVNMADGQRTILHFEGVDYHAKIWVNGAYAGDHTGGYTRFSLDITELLHSGENYLTVRAEDTFRLCQPRGKQRWQSESFVCWYPPISGIWKTVWLEFCPATRLEHIHMTPLVSQQALNVGWSLAGFDSKLPLVLAASISFQGIHISTVTTEVADSQGAIMLPVGSREVDPWLIKLWSPEHPYLYDITFELHSHGEVIDRVQSYFGMREVRTDDGQVLLNGDVLYQRLVLDQGYWAETSLTPPNEEAIIADIDLMIKLGFNGARKHQKIEDERYYFWCDVKGLLTWCEMPSCYQFGEDAVSALSTQWLEVVRQHYNHPSIIVWTPFNESWGVPDIKTNPEQQHWAQSIYHLTKSIDPTRLVVLNDGWEHTVTDIVTIHDYAQSGALLHSHCQDSLDQVLNGSIRCNSGKPLFAEGFSYQGQPIFISEFGGSRLERENTFGYGEALASQQALVSKISELTSAITESNRICGFCYTQLTDVFQEQNGLLTADRQYKANAAKLHKIFASGQ